MRISNALGVLLLGAAIALPARAPAQVSVSVNLGRLLGPEISIFAYSQADHGDWQTSYRNWTPVTIYDYNGHYYRKSVKGSRAVVVYSRNNEYFFPPQDNAWVGKDKRYNYKRQPTENDRGRAKSKGQNPGRGRGKP